MYSQFILYSCTLQFLVSDAVQQMHGLATMLWPGDTASVGAQGAKGLGKTQQDVPLRFRLGNDLLLSA